MTDRHSLLAGRFVGSVETALVAFNGNRSLDHEAKPGHASAADLIVRELDECAGRERSVVQNRVDLLKQNPIGHVALLPVD